MKRQMRRFGVLAATALLFVAACGPTRYTEYRAQSQAVPMLERSVAMHVGREFYRPTPGCAVVMPVAGQATPGLRRAVEAALYRHLVTKLPNVVGPRVRRREVRKLAINLRHEPDRAILTRAVRCSVLVEAKIWQSNEDFALVWSRKNLDLEIVMLRRERLLWKGRHNADRSDGGVPLSPLSAPFAVARASRLHGDGDAMISLVDDTVRRIVASLPDVR